MNGLVGGFTRGALIVSVPLALAAVGVRLWLVQPPPDRYRSGVFEFSLPKGWSCKNEGAMTTCYPSKTPPYDAVCVLAMKFRGPMDTMAEYRAHLSERRTVEGSNGEAHLSDIVEAPSTREIGGVQWATGMQDNSEIPSYRTMYFGTMTPDVAILVTFSVHRRSIDKYQAIFENMIASLQVYK